jgi:hypothetical protein
VQERALEAIDNPSVAAVFATYSERNRLALLGLRQLILDVATSTSGVGPLDETLKWGQPSYLTTESKSGTTVRIDQLSDDQVALFVSCQTDLMATFKAIYPDRFRYHGKRALIFSPNEPMPVDELRHCIALALTYKSRKKPRMASHRGRQSRV